VFTVRYGLYILPDLTSTNSTFCPHSVLMCFVWISEQTAIVSLYSINWLVFITETECVYCAVQAESWNVIVFNICLYTFNPNYISLTGEQVSLSLLQQCALALPTFHYSWLSTPNRLTDKSKDSKAFTVERHFIKLNAVWYIYLRFLIFIRWEI
jgi:hypothetical protein